MRTFVSRYPVISFALLTLVFQFVVVFLVMAIHDPAIHLAEDRLSKWLFRIRVLGPLAACMLVTWYLERGPGLKKLFGSYAHWRTSPKWYVIAITWKFLLAWAGLGLTVLFTDSIWPGFFAPNFLPGYLEALPFILVATFVEETSWIRFSISRFQEKFSALTSTVFVGLLWGLWYVPMFFLGEGWPDGNPVYVFVPCIIALAIFLAVMYNSSHSGTVLLLTQVSSNSVFMMVPLLPGYVRWPDGSVDDNYLFGCSIAFIVFSLALVFILGSKNLARRERVRWSDPAPEDAEAVVPARVSTVG